MAEQKEREERRAAAYANIKIKTEKLNAAREAIVDLFPSRETDMGMVQETEVEIEEEEEEEEELPEPGPEVAAVEEVAAPKRPTLSPPSPPPELLRPEDVDPISAARERLVNAFPTRGAGEMVGGVMEEVVPVSKAATKRKTPAARKKKAAVEATAEASAAPELKKPATAKKKKSAAKTTKTAAKAASRAGSEEEPVPTELPKKAATKTTGRKKAAAASADEAAEAAPPPVAPTMLNGNSMREAETAATATTTPDDYDELSEDLSRALGGVQGYDLDSIDLEMEDLRPEDLEVRWGCPRRGIVIFILFWDRENGSVCVTGLVCFCGLVAAFSRFAGVGFVFFFLVSPRAKEGRAKGLPDGKRRG